MSKLKAAAVESLGVMEQALSYADAVESDGYAESWLDTKTGARVSWSNIRRSISNIQKALSAPAEQPSHRWNIERDGDALLICFNEHDKGEKCEYVRYVPAE